MEAGGQRDSLLAKPDMDLPDALQLGELAKDQDERLAHAQIRIFLDPVGPATNLAHRDHHEQLAAPGLLFERFMGALA